MYSNTDTITENKKNSNTAIRNILVFHKLTNRLTFGSTNYSPKRITRLFDELKSDSYRFVSLNELLDSPDEKNVAVTFDDGYAHLMEWLPRLVDKFQIQPTVFIPTGFIGKKNDWDYSAIFRSERHLDKEEIKELSSIGVEFGSHGHSHSDLTGMGSTLAKNELSESKGILEDITGKSVNFVSYPFGRTNADVMKLVRDSGYKAAFTMKFPQSNDTEMNLGRTAVYFFDSTATVGQKLGGGGFRKIHQGIGGVINRLSYGTIIWNRLTQKDEKSRG